eukprot:3113281-Amphidinium_carterae.1
MNSTLCCNPYIGTFPPPPVGKAAVVTPRTQPGWGQRRPEAEPRETPPPLHPGLRKHELAALVYLAGAVILTIWKMFTEPLIGAAQGSEFSC